MFTMIYTFGHLTYQGDLSDVHKDFVTFLARSSQIRIWFYDAMSGLWEIGIRFQSQKFLTRRRKKGPNKTSQLVSKVL